MNDLDETHPDDVENQCDQENGVPDGWKVRKLEVRKRIVGRRLDKYLQGKFPRISRTTLQRPSRTNTWGSC